MALVDLYGNPMRKEELLEEQAGPTVTGVRQIMSGHPAAGITPQKLARLMREADDGNIESYLELAEEIEEKDGHYVSVLGTRKRAVCQLEITVEPGGDTPEDKKNAELIEQFLKRDCLEEELFDIQDAVGKGFSITEIIWELSENQWMPKALKWRDPRWFEFDRNDGTTVKPAVLILPAFWIGRT